MESVDAINALSAGFSNFAPPPPASVKVQHTFTSVQERRLRQKEPPKSHNVQTFVCNILKTIKKLNQEYKGL